MSYERPQDPASNPERRKAKERREKLWAELVGTGSTKELFAQQDDTPPVKIDKE